MEFDETLLQKLNQISLLFPRVSTQLITEVIEICYKVENVWCHYFNFNITLTTKKQRVVFRLEEFTRKIWPTYRPVVVDIIDCLCDKSNEKDSFLTSQFIRYFSFRLIEIMASVLMCRDIQKHQLLSTIKKWKTANTFEFSLCEELEFLVESSIYPTLSANEKENTRQIETNQTGNSTNTGVINIDDDSSDKVLEVKEGIQSDEISLPNDPRKTGRERSWCKERKHCSSRDFTRDISPQRSFSPRSSPNRNSRSTSRRRSLSRKPYHRRYSRDRSRSHSRGYDGQRSPQRRGPRQKNSRNPSRERSYSPQRRCPTKWGSYYHNESLLRPSERETRRNFTRSPKRNSRGYPPTEVEVRDIPEERAGHERLGQRQTNYYARKQKEKNNYLRTFFGLEEEMGNGGGMEQKQSVDEKRLNRALVPFGGSNGSKPIQNMEEVKKIEKELNEVVLEQPKVEKEETKLVKTNAIIFCDIPLSWKTKDEIKKQLGNVIVNSVDILQEHKCCLVSFVKHEDAMKFKVTPVQNTGTCWGKEKWMKNCLIREDGVVEIPVKCIPKNVRIFRDGTYEFLE